ncbi:carbohydrate ABC transporter permease [Micromonospora sp. NPDC047740]|uniref:carbohydrate ABC transporter permease n=1 Tax=Micromonospora sp. NPDC047740 TaxID=3364254 RepID=UPI003715791C
MTSTPTLVPGGAAEPAAPPRRVAAARRRRPGRLRRYAWHYVFLAPMLLLFVAFTLWPMVASWWYSFFDWDGVGPATDWVGFSNFAEVLQSRPFWHAFGNSFLFSLVAICVEMPLALLAAILLNSRRLCGRNLYRLLLFLPVVTTTAVIGIVFAIMLDPAGGFVNDLLTSVGLVDSPITFLSESYALPTVMAVDVWKGFGITLVYWLAALQTVPDDLYEAAKIDGANGRQTLRHVTLPVIAPIGVVILLLTFQKSMNPFDLVQAMTEGGPNHATDVVATYIYRYAFDPYLNAPRYGFACAAGVVFGVITLVMTALQGPLLRRQYLKGSR